MEKLNSFTYMADKDYIFVDKETEEINHGNLIQIGLIENDGEYISDSIDNYKEVLLEEFMESKNKKNYIENFKETWML